MRLTDRELDIMAVLWDRGPSTVAEVRDALSDDLAYNTVLTMLRIMEGKGQVRREKEGRAHRYAPALERDAVGATALRRLADHLFHGSREAVLLGLVEAEGVDPEEIRRMRDLLNERLGPEE
jgi:predicted transcriptional regulator